VTASAEPEFAGPARPGPRTNCRRQPSSEDFQLPIMYFEHCGLAICRLKSTLNRLCTDILWSPMTSPRAVSWREAPLTPSMLATPQSGASHYISPGSSASQRSSAIRTKLDAGGFLNFYTDHDRSCASTHIMPHQVTVSATAAGDSPLTGAQVSQARLPDDPQSSTLARSLEPKDSRISPYQRKVQTPQSNEVEPL
jgi:hypothetical protein